ncbi:MarR family winged helix-turn-helix transcriptional regulator [Haloactinomyces albus]|uniref:DNA-binding MarR family transcriptional regulator n=1 Tax=Haloactinomyces albus TaxID=1352928 RepID=A0AAE4CKV0_9ACTN|nr:MarR family transcriptional regulator [Haloactinomyces albus]MDR7301495.1 DNA-binding MarR family transcriptional regulator [Haloactinomyces albus]
MHADHAASTEQRELATVLRNLAWTIDRLVPEVAGLDPLPTTELAVIKYVQASPGITVSELARHLGMQQSNVSAAVRDLVERGLVARESSPADRRVTRLVPTEKSLAAKDSIDTVWSGTIRAAMGRLTHEQVAAIEAASGALQALDQALHTEQPEPRAHQ